MAGNRTLKLSILADVDDLKKKLGQGEQEVQRIFIQCAAVPAAQPNAQLSPQLEPIHGDDT